MHLPLQSAYSFLTRPARPVWGHAQRHGGRQDWFAWGQKAATLPRVSGRFGKTLSGKRLALVTAVMVLSGMVLGSAALGAGVPRAISINGAALHPVIESKWLPSGREGLPVWFLPRLGIQTRNDPQNLWLVYGASSLHWEAAAGKGRWTGPSGAQRLGPPESYGGSLHVPLDALRLLGLPMLGDDTSLNVTVSRAARELPVAAPPSASLASVNSVASTSSGRAVPVPKPVAPAVSVAAVTAPASATTQPSTPKASAKAANTTPGNKAAVAVTKPQPSVTVPANLTRPPAATAPSRPTTLPPLPAAPTVTLSRAVSITAPRASVEITAPVSVIPVSAISVSATPISNPPTSAPGPAPVSRPAPTNTASSSTNPSGTTSSSNTPSSPAPLPSPEVPIIGPRVTGIRSSLSTVRNIAAQRLVIDLTGPVQYSVQRGGNGSQVSVFLLGASAAPAQLTPQRLDSGDLLSLTAGSNAAGRPGLNLRLQTRGAVGQIQTLQNPDRLVIDSAAATDDSSPPPINEAALPQGVSLRVLGAVSLLSFDPALFKPRVVAAPVGSALSVAELVRRVGGVAGVNGGYFDPPSSLGVDFVTVAGQMLSSSLEKRAAVGFEPQGKVIFGYPRPRYFAEGDFGSVLVNTVSSRANPALLTAFVGDGRTAVGAAGLTTLLVDGGKVLRVSNTPLVPAVGIMALSFDPARFPALPRSMGAKLNVRLDYQLQSWDGVREGLAAGPLLLQGGKVVLDPVREAFNIYTGIWRPTRQVAFAVYEGQPTIAFMDFGTPESFAAALQRAGVSDAMRLDSGSSATVFVTGGYLGNGGYLNTVWSRPVPNAIVFVPK